MHQPFSRRAALKASGVAIALPLLESMSSAIGGTEIPTAKRMVLICNTLGLYSPALYPEKTGRNYKSTEYLDLLKDHREKFTLISGLSHPDQNGKQPHDTEMTWLTAARNPGLAGFKNSISVDQYAASKLGQVTRFRSIALSTNLQKSQSYNSNGVMLPAEHKPSKVFERLFFDGSPAQINRNRQGLAEGRSILDFVRDQAQSLKRRTSRNDHRQLDEYFNAIRNAESELIESEAWLDRPKPQVKIAQPKDIADPRDLIGRTKSLLNLMPIILQTDSSRVITLVIQDHGVVPKIKGVNAEHHNLSHHGQDPEKIKQLKIIERQLLECFAQFLSSMSQPLEAGRSLLKNTSVLFGSNLGNANAHDPKNLPVLLAGGDYEHGRYVAQSKTDNVPLCNLFVNLLNNVGVETEKFGTSTGTLEI